MNNIDSAKPMTIAQRCTSLSTEYIVDIIADMEREQQRVASDLGEVREILRQRMKDEGATVHCGHGYRAEIEQMYKNDVRVSELAALQGLVSEADFKKAVWTVTPEPVTKTHVTHLKALAKYGTAVQEILDRAIVRYADGPPKLVITEIKPDAVNVTGSGRAEIAA